MIPKFMREEVAGARLADREETARLADQIRDLDPHAAATIKRIRRGEYGGIYYGNSPQPTIVNDRSTVYTVLLTEDGRARAARNARARRWHFDFSHICQALTRHERLLPSGRTATFSFTFAALGVDPPPLFDPLEYGEALRFGRRDLLAELEGSPQMEMDV